MNIIEPFFLFPSRLARRRDSVIPFFGAAAVRSLRAERHKAAGVNYYRASVYRGNEKKKKKKVPRCS